MKTSGIVLLFAALTGAVSAKKKLDAWFYSDNECKGTGEKDAYGKKWDVYNNACQNYEQTKRKAIWMTADSDSSSAPYTYCVKVSDGPECSGTTYGIEFKTERKCVQYFEEDPELHRGLPAEFEVKSVRFEYAPCGDSQFAFTAPVIDVPAL